MENVIELKTTKAYVAEVKPFLSQEDMLQKMAEGYLIDGFLGGVEITTQEIEEHFLNSDEPNYEKWIRSYVEGGMLTYKSLDGSKCLVRICRPKSPTSWIPSDAEIFGLFKQLFGTERFLTKSKFQAKIESEEYREPTNEV